MGLDHIEFTSAISYLDWLAKACDSKHDASDRRHDRNDD
jgi:hypothetical protein